MNPLLSLSVVDCSRLRDAATVLVRHGITTPALDAAVQRAQWPALLQLQLVTDIAAHSSTAAQLGIDVAMLPVPPPDAPAPGTIGGRASGCQSGDVTPSEVSSLQDASEILKPVGTPLDFDGTLDSLRGISVSELDVASPTQLENLAASSVDTVWDVLMRVPLRYLNRTELLPISALQPGMKAATFVGNVRTIQTSYGPTQYCRISVGDANASISVMFFQAPWMSKRFRRGDRVIVHGDIGEFNNRPTISSPIIETLEDSTAPWVPIYPQSQKNRVSTWLIQRLAVAALRRIPHLSDPIPVEVRQSLGIPSRIDALRALHVPQSAEEANRGRDRLAFDELFRLQLAIGVVANTQKNSQGIAHHCPGQLVQQWQANLPFGLTVAQQRAIQEIRNDLASTAPMNRLLQGDVGAGKTAVITAAALSVVEGGRQAVIVAPSEILARQHHAELAEALEPLGVQVDLLVSAHLPRKRRDVLADLASGASNIAVGTHSLLMDSVAYKRLGCVVVDEQHRFGVDQRAALAGRGDDGKMPDMLQATATPIPRTAAITEFGDMTLSILDEKPPGRSPIETTWVENGDPLDEYASCWQAVREQVRGGHQAFIVCPLVKSSSGKASETKMAAAADDVAQLLTQGALAGLSVDVVHGKLKPKDRAERMQRFTAGETDVLVATTVIEVGVSVPNATVMVILDAAKFGLAQLHQLRGRVGRGRWPGQCWLVGQANGDGAARMRAMVSTDDGFALSAMDLEIRGPGSLISTVQAGKQSGLVVADLIADEGIHLQARQQAQALLARDALLSRHTLLRTEVEIALGDRAEYLSRS